eukprot:CAMPEP_0206306302 /NCGR_PEP_ID=MMETSP0106_2-20121207/10727_1 /ASSEMBLY_ACC=CAM_ASM_000206 /TAXON_ID=81532 /ORGANISM="Acanthoeca-like sp., Strain 10tr" /LENGTH=809 /DNA_ID=CAMNT_0053737213 /DNA_START=108 /DNA_END=2537 /DNA_ORIENTATION=+
MPSSKVAVAIRVRPFKDFEVESMEEHGESVEIEDDSITMVQKLNAAHEIKREFHFDHCYNSMNHLEHVKPSSNAEIYRDMIASSVNDVCNGYNVNVLLYGQTGTGKTYSLEGTDEDHGIVPRTCEDLFKHLDIRPGTKVSASYIEIYNEQVFDLLNPKVLAERKAGAKAGKTEVTALRVREHPELGPFADGQMEVPVGSAAEAADVYQRGRAARATCATLLAPESSRSHGRFMFTLIHPKGNKSGLSLIDLGGTGQGDGRGSKGKSAAKMQAEGAAINKSLATLGMVMGALAKAAKNKDKKIHIPYRDSSLTWLLKSALGGNSRTVFLAFVSPCVDHYDESVSTLRYAERASAIVNTATTKLTKSKAVLEAEAEAARLAAEEEAERQRIEAEEEAERQRIEAEDAALEAAIAAKNEAMRVRKEKEAAEEAARKAAEEEAARKEAERLRKEKEAAEEAARKAAEEEAARIAAEKEAERLRKEKEAAEEAARKAAEEEAARIAAKKEAERLRKEKEEAERIAAEEAAAERARKEAERARFEMEMKMKQEAELARQRAEEAAAKEALEKKRLEEEQQREADRKAEAERTRLAEESARKERDEARKKAEAARLKAEEDRKKKEEAKRRALEEQAALTNAPAAEAARLAEAEARAKAASAERKARAEAEEDAKVDAVLAMMTEDAEGDRALWKLKQKRAEEERKRIEIEKQAKITTDADANGGQFTLTTKLRAVKKDEMRGDQRDPNAAGAITKKKKKKKDKAFELPLSPDGGDDGAAKKTKKKKKKKDGFQLPTVGGDGDSYGAVAPGNNPFL